MIMKLLIMALAIPWAKCRQNHSYIGPTGPVGVDDDGRSWTSVDSVTSGLSPEGSAGSLRLRQQEPPQAGVCALICCASRGDGCAGTRRFVGGDGVKERGPGGAAIGARSSPAALVEGLAVVVGQGRWRGCLVGWLQAERGACWRFGRGR